MLTRDPGQEQQQKFYARPRTYGRRPAVIEQIVLATIRRHLITREELLSVSQRADVVAARRRICLEMRAQGLAVSQIARFLNVHHSSVLNHLKKAKLAGLKAFDEFDQNAPDESGVWAI